MKKTSFLLLIGAALYSWLFYEQIPGINFLIFSIALLVLSVINRKEVVTYAAWRVAAAGVLISGLCIARHGNGLSFIANIISLGVVSMLSVNKKSSVPAALLTSFVMLVSSWLLIFLDRFMPGRWKKEEKRIEAQTDMEAMPASPSKDKFTTRLLVFGIPLVFIVVFISLYRASNPVFDYFASLINFDFISLGWVMFAISGVLVMYAFFYNRELKRVSNYDINASGLILTDKANKQTWLNTLLSVVNENTSGIVLFVSLNILLLLLNIVDINYTILGMKLPKGISHSQVVHQGVNGLIWSIILAVAIILYHFRGRLNFYANNKALKTLAYIWIAQNIFMVFSTGVRNYMYISADGITAKRIGVYIYLALCIIGLVFTFIKIMKRYTNWQLVRQVSWAFYGALILCCFVNWEAFITDYNVEWEGRHNRPVDGGYLISLNTSYLDQLVDSRNKLLASDTAANGLKPVMPINARTKTIVNDSLPEHWAMIDNEIYMFLCEQNRTDWRSWNIDDNEIDRKIEKLKQGHKLNTLFLYGDMPDEYGSLSTLGLKNLSIENGILSSCEKLGNLQTLHELRIKRCVVSSFAGIEKMQNLNVLRLDDISSNDFLPVTKLKNLHKLYCNVNYTNGMSIDSLKILMPNTEIITQ